MSLFGLGKMLIGRTKVTLAASKLFIDGHHLEAFDMVHSYILKDENLKHVLLFFQATTQDIANIFAAMRIYTCDEVHKGEAIPVAALLNLDTLSYLIRAERGQVNKDEAYSSAQKFLRTGALVFQPEKKYRIDHGL